MAEDINFNLRNLHAILIQLNQTIERGFNNVSSKLADITAMLNNNTIDANVDLSEITSALEDIKTTLDKK